MKWKTPKSGDRRHRSGFLFFPKNIEHETRWWVYAEWEQRHYGTTRWYDDKWLN